MTIGNAYRDNALGTTKQTCDSEMCYDPKPMVFTSAEEDADRRGTGYLEIWKRSLL